jgi:hypothetical protein
VSNEAAGPERMGGIMVALATGCGVRLWLTTASADARRAPGQPAADNRIGWTLVVLLLVVGLGAVALGKLNRKI